MNSEIKNIMALRGIESSLDQDAEVKILTWDDQWTTYDDASSFKLKTDFARSECLGGMMVWAVSHDNPNGTFSRSLSDTTIQPFTSLAGYRSDGGPSANITIYEQHPQCMWTGCGEVCASGYTAVSRGYSGARNGDPMLDQTRCPSDSVHTYCCPSNSAMPTCGWYTHNNRKCDPACPDNTVEIGSNSMY
jgi:chitinase